MIRGIGVDMVDIREMDRLINSTPSFLHNTFTATEIAVVNMNEKPRAEYFAAQFAVKEAVFKAVAHLTQTFTSFDFRLVEARRHEDGYPYVYISDTLKPILEEADITALHLSITTEENCAAAFVIAEKHGYN